MSSAGPGRREVAHRLFAAEYDDASLEYAESDEERAPNYVVTPSGARVNRLFVVGVLTAVEQVNEDTVRARIADPTGAFVVYAGQYQPDELAALQSLEAPAFIAVTGKANTFSPEGSDRVLTSVRPESVTEVDAETRDRWVAATAEHTLARVQTATDALGREERGEDLRAALLRDRVDPGLAEGITKAIDHYGTTADYLGALRDLATQALEVVAAERSEVEPLEVDPDGGDGTLSAGDLAGLLEEDRLAVTRAAGNVDPEALLEHDPADVEPDASEGDDAEASEGAAAESEPEEEPERSEAEAESGTMETESTEPEAESAEESSAEAPVASEDAGEQPEAAESAGAEDVDETPDVEPETEGAGTAETEADAEEGVDVDAGEAADAEDEATDDAGFEVDEEEREQIEEEYGVGFQSGTEVDPAGEAGIETEAAVPDDETGDDGREDDASDEEATETPETEEAGDDEGDGDETGADEAADGDVDLESVLLDEMAALDDGDGADRQGLIDAVAAETGADADAVDDAIDDLLMSGQCYEPSEDALKPI